MEDVLEGLCLEPPCSQLHKRSSCANSAGSELGTTNSLHTQVLRCHDDTKTRFT